MARLEIVRSTDIWSLLASILMILLGTYVWAYPLEALVAIALYLGIGLIIIGIGYMSRTDMIVGILDILFGIILVSNPRIAATALPIIFGLWCVMVGITQLYISFQVRNTYSLWFWPLISGIFGLIFGLSILIYPRFGFLTIPVLLGIYLVLYGIVGVLEYIQGRKLHQ